MLTPSQITWAAQHDWFVSNNGDGTITVRDCGVLDQDGVYHYNETIAHWTRTFKQLRDWAGY